jgi:hypothetical protein
MAHTAMDATAERHDRAIYGLILIALGLVTGVVGTFLGGAAARPAAGDGVSS